MFVFFLLLKAWPFFLSLVTHLDVETLVWSYRALDGGDLGDELAHSWLLITWWWHWSATSLAPPILPGQEFQLWLLINLPAAPLFSLFLVAYKLKNGALLCFDFISCVPRKLALAPKCLLNSFRPVRRPIPLPLEPLLLSTLWLGRLTAFMCVLLPHCFTSWLSLEPHRAVSSSWNIWY